jgi:hypothetical protein
MTQHRASERHSTERHSTEHHSQGAGPPDAGSQPPPTAERPSPAGKPSGSLHSWLMTACLVLMGGAFLLVMWRGQTTGGLLLLLPMLLCLGAHFLLHRHYGRHGDD